MTKHKQWLKQLLPNLAKVPPKVSLAIIGASILLAYVSTLRTAIAFDLGEWTRNTINSAARSTSGSSQPLPVVNNYDSSDCLPRTVANSAPVPTTRNGSYWESGVSPQDDRAKVLLNLAPGTKRKAVNSRVGMGTNDNGSALYDTSDGMIRVNYKFGQRLLDDQVEWVGVVR